MQPVRTEPDDPHRCKAPVSNGQCPYKAEQGSDYCSNHDGGRQLAVAERNNYLLGKAQQLKVSAPQIVQDLEDEIQTIAYLLRMTIERAQSDKELILARPQIQSLVTTLERLKKTNQDLQRKHGQVLSKPAVARLASKVVEIVLNQIRDLPDFEERADMIITEVSNALSSAQNEEGDL